MTPYLRSLPHPAAAPSTVARPPRTVPGRPPHGRLALLALVLGALACTSSNSTPARAEAPAPPSTTPAETRPGAEARPTPPLPAKDAPATVAGQPIPSALRGVELAPYFADAAGAKALRLFDDGKNQEAAAAFDALVSADPDGKSALAASYLAAVSLHYAGKHAEAARRFALLANVQPLLADYHHGFRAASLLEANDPKGALEAARAVSDASVPAARASLVAGRALLALGRAADAADHMTRHIKKHGRDADAQLLLARALGRAGKKREAATAYRLVMARWPLSADSRAALAALKELTAGLPRKERDALMAFTAEEELLRGKKLFDMHKSEDAITLLSKLSKRFKKGTKQRCTALSLTARSWDKLRKRKPAHPYYAAYASECGAVDDEFPMNLYLGGKSYVQTGDYGQALDMFAKLHREFPEHSTNDDALVYEAYIWNERKDAARERKALLKAIDLYPTGDKRDEVSWQLVWDAWATGDMKKVVAEADRALARIDRESTYYSEGRTLYWKGRAKARLGKPDEARDAWKAVLETYPMSYYAHLSYSRIVELSGEEEARALFDPIVAAVPPPEGSLFEGSDTLRDEPAFRRGIELLRMGLTAAAKREMDRLPRGSKGRDWLLAWLYDRVGAYPLSHNIPRRKHPDFARSYPKGEHTIAWLVAFPRPFADDVRAGAAAAGIAPELAWSIMREESGFSPSIESWANAVGLMQLLVPTGKHLIEKGESDEVSAETLRDPALNIRLGTRYLGKLQARFESPALAAAGYNAGGGGVGKWMRERGTLPLDEFVELIPYRQTRDYTKRVMGTLGTYLYLYEGELLVLPNKLAPASRWEKGVDF